MTKGERSVLANVPTAVYRFYDSEGCLLYVGMTHDIDERWGTHERIQPWWLDVSRHEFTWYSTRAEAKQIEATATAVEKPRFDRSGKRTAGGEWDDRLATETDRATMTRIGCCWPAGTWRSTTDADWRVADQLNVRR